MSDVNASRSDCHAWVSSVQILNFSEQFWEFYTDAPGFTKVRITPHLGNLKKIQGELPNRHGTISVKYHKQKNYWDIEIILPQNLNGVLVWNGKSYPIRAGKNNFRW